MPPPGGLPNPGIKPESPASPALQADSLLTEPSGKPKSKLRSIASSLSILKAKSMHACLSVSSLCQCLFKKEGTLKNG